MKRTPVRRTKSEKAKAADWWSDVMRSTGGRCLISGEWAQDAHHVLPQQTLKRRNLHAHLWDPRNGIPLARRVHERHTTAVERITRDQLPPAALEFAEELGLTHLIERYYPEGAAGVELV